MDIANRPKLCETVFSGLLSKKKIKILEMIFNTQFSCIRSFFTMPVQSLFCVVVIVDHFN